MRLRIIDGIGPFFRAHPETRINWSKIPFELFEGAEPTRGQRHAEVRIDEDALRAIRPEFRRFVERAADLGFTHVTLDDLAHLYDWPGHLPAQRRRVDAYRRQFRWYFRAAADVGLKVLLTADVLSYTPELWDDLKDRPKRIARWLRDAAGSLLDDFPQIDGLILRIGESDGVDVEGDFRSRLVLRKPAQLRRLIETMLPAFEQRDRLLILRTWSVGAFRVGDLIWNRNTFTHTFDGLHSQSFVVSMKYGESDFFRYLPLNAHFFRSDHQKVLEVQARREYEGFGEFPSFVGWQYAHFAEQLRQARNLIGVSVWSQTGGWTRFRRLALLDEEAMWIDLNVETSLQVLTEGASPEQAIARFCERRGRPEAAPHLVELLRLCEVAIHELLYVREFAEQKLFFRRLRLPPLLVVHWDNILVNHTVRQVMRALVRDPDEAVWGAERGLKALRRMVDLAEAAQVPRHDLEFMVDTFEILLAARRYYFEEFGPHVVQRLHSLHERYQQRWGDERDHLFQLHLDFRPIRWRSDQVARLLDIVLRRQRGYRLIDEVVMLRLLRFARPLLRIASRRVAPEFANETAMGVDSLLL